MIGKIMKGIAGFYYVGVVESGVYECKAKGIFRKDKIKPLVGDDVEIEVLNEEEKLGNIVKILPRRSELIRPAVANIDQALVIFAAREPNRIYVTTKKLDVSKRFMKPVDIRWCLQVQSRVRGLKKSNHGFVGKRQQLQDRPEWESLH